ncbi:Rz1-like lysis system protein LysC [Basilea psittacipulmonis]
MRKSVLKTLLIVIVLLSLLSGCSHFNKPLQKPTLPYEVVAPCPTVQPLKNNSWDALATAYIELLGQYTQCSAKHDSMVDLYQR